ncbi:hypothetical protein M3694_09095 [Kocuria marina]|uniref:hypothetical protein n=1 Tax=Kocuria marina TaxID=223184 RepID=UPI00298A0241|nr:hypothetical protein [Kocuria marina]MCT2361878.1 hypothetical protein [Kocuria marina]
MTPSLATYIALPGTTAEAMEHWHDVFGGDLHILRYGDMDLQGMPFKPDPQAVAHSTPTTPLPSSPRSVPTRPCPGRAR